MTRILSSFYSDGKKVLEFFAISAIANYFGRADFVMPSTHIEKVVESESASSFETDFDLTAPLKSIYEVITNYSTALC